MATVAIRRVRNQFEVRGDVAVMFLRRKSGPPLEVLIDPADIPKVQAYPGTWRAAKSIASQLTYVVARRIQSSGELRLHRYLLDAPPGVLVDHINHNTFDNRRCNLRLATVVVNSQNTRIARANTTTGIRNVRWSPHKQKYRVCLRIDGHQRQFGYFASLADATEVATKMRAQYFPECLNETVDLDALRNLPMPSAKHAMGLQRYRRRAGMSQPELARRLNPPVRDDTVSYWERGVGYPGKKYLEQLPGLLGCSLDDILGSAEAAD